MAQHIKFKPRKEKIIQVILYLAHKKIELSRYKIVKLVYLADYIHLNRYRRPITYDTMTAMHNGPVPSTLYNILKKDRRYGIDYESLPFDFVQVGNRHYIENPKEKINRKLFSASDLEVLDEVVEKYGNSTFRELYDLTHEHAGYKQAWEKRGKKGSREILFEDMIVDIKGREKDNLIERMLFTCKHVA